MAATRGRAPTTRSSASAATATSSCSRPTPSSRGATGHAYGGLVPFFIDWRGSPHPSGQLPPQLTCVGLTLAHPDAWGLERLLDALGGPPAGVRVERAEAPALTATWRGATGTTSSTGRGGPC